MKFYNKILLFTAFFLLHHYATYSQGCIAIRACGGSLGTAPNLAKGDFAVQTNYRYFKSFRHFRGDHEEAERVEAGTIINKSHFGHF
ncbi:MAG: hypothetical protein IPL35_00690 [Sphingobacteriales bacterium]|nr:hypothetical protein [Sphingobacteriales bacterium]